MRVLLVRNPGAAAAKTAARPEVEDELRALGDVEVLVPTSAGAFEEELRRAVRREDLVVVGGGDGTLGDAVNALGARLDDVVFALLPSGTGNDFARSLGIPLDVSEAAASLLTARERTIDIGAISDGTRRRLFVNACMGGFPVQVDREVDEDLKRRLGPLAFWWGGLKAARELQRYEVALEGERMTDVVAVGVGNGRSAGGGIEVFPNASLADGLLDVCVFSAAGPLQTARLALDTKSGEHVATEGVETRRLPAARIDAAPSLEFNVDGEALGMGTPVTVEIARRMRFFC